MTLTWACDNVLAAVVMALWLSSIVLCCQDALYGLLGWLLWSYSYPVDLTDGRCPPLSWPLGVLLVCCTLWQRRRLFVRDARMVLYGALVLVLTLSSTDRADVHFIWFLKNVLVAGMIPVLVDTRERFRLYLRVIAVGVGVVALAQGLAALLCVPILDGGVDCGLAGPPGERNDYALILCMMIPIFYHLARTERKGHVPLVYWSLLAGTLGAVVATYSRSGAIALSGAIIYLASTSRRRKRAFCVVVLAIPLLSLTLPSAYTGRLLAMRSAATADPSAANRLVIWRTATRMAKTSPWFGVGFGQGERLIGRYHDPATGRAVPTSEGRRAMHNSFLSVLVDAGLPAACLWLAAFLWGIVAAWRTSRQAASRGDPRLADWGRMLVASLLAYLAVGLVQSTQYAGIAWHMLGLGIALDHLPAEPTN
jgi:hypothetical protein